MLESRRRQVDPHRNRPEARRERPKVLVADDSPLVLRMIEKMLDAAGFAVVTARDGLEAMEKAFAEDVSLVILDVMMPRMNGYQACRLLKTEPPTKAIPVVILTSKDQAGDRFWGLETGADYYITKDADPQKHPGAGEEDRGLATRAPAPRGAEAAARASTSCRRVNELLDRKLFETTILSEIGRVARSLVHFDETFTSVMGVARAGSWTSRSARWPSSSEDDLDVFLMLQRPAAPNVIEEAKARLLEAIARERVGAPFTKVQARLFAPSGARPAPEETTLGGFAAFPVKTNGALRGPAGLRRQGRRADRRRDRGVPGHGREPGQDGDGEQPAVRAGRAASRSATA